MEINCDYSSAALDIHTEFIVKMKQKLAKLTAYYLFLLRMSVLLFVYPTQQWIETSKFWNDVHTGAGHHYYIALALIPAFIWTHFKNRKLQIHILSFACALIFEEIMVILDSLGLPHQRYLSPFETGLQMGLVGLLYLLSISLSLKNQQQSHPGVE